MPMSSMASMGNQLDEFSLSHAHVKRRSQVTCDFAKYYAWISSESDPHVGRARRLHESEDQA